MYRKYANLAETTDKGEYEDLRTAKKLLYSKESQIPPRELQDFQALWDEDACKRCRECNARVDNDKIYCKKHEDIEKVVPGTCISPVRDLHYVKSPDDPFDFLAPFAEVEGPETEDGDGPERPVCGGEVQELANGTWACKKCEATRQKTCSNVAGMAAVEGPVNKDGFGPPPLFCGGQMKQLHNGAWQCKKCGYTEQQTNSEAASSTDNPLSDILNRHQESFKQFSKLFSTQKRCRPEGVPQWTKRQRL